MRLLSYHIENYGKLHDQDGVFQDGVTCICEKNGFGKTTLSSFIKAMLYGLPSYTAKTKAFDDRQHFYPFSGGKFGGNLTFEKDGKTYKIERFFDKKSSKGDEMLVYCNGAPSMEFGEDIGKALFGLDEESFQKTVFITADEIEIASTHAINERLNRTDFSEESGYDDAIAALEKAKKNLRAARGNNDKISEKTAQIREITAQIGNLREMSGGLETEYTERERLVKALAALESEQKSVNEQELLLQRWETLDTMAKQAEADAAALDALREKYPQGLPTEEERTLLREYIQKENLLQGGLATAEFEEDKNNALKALGEKFSGGIPDEEIFAEKQKEVRKAAALSAEIGALTAYQETERERVLKGRFGLKCPTEQELEKKRMLAETYKRKDSELKELSARLLQTAPKQEKGRGGKTVLALLISSIVLLGVGIALAFVVMAVGLALAAIGGALGIIALLSNKGASGVTISSRLHLDAAALQTDLKETEGKLYAFTAPYGYYSAAGAAYDFAVLEEDVKAYRTFEAAAQERMARLNEKTAAHERLTAELLAFLQNFGAQSTDLQAGLNRVLADAEKYRSLQADKRTAVEKKEGFLKEREENRAAVSKLVEKYGLSQNAGTMDGLTELERAAESIEKYAQDFARMQKNIEEYKAKNALDERPAALACAAEEVYEEISRVRNDLVNCDKRIAETERYVEQLPDLEAALERAEEQLTQYKEKHGLLSDVIDALKNAEQRLKDKYVAPIKDRFSHYAETIEKVLNEKISMDKDFRIMFERNGQSRDERHLSAGERAICALCLRLALIDNMYGDNQPFIVMDDPFVHLDEGHLADTVKLVKALGQNRQILYFCCHESREIK